MITDITELAKSLKAAAEKATPGPWRRSSVRFNGITDIANPMEQGSKPHVANASEKRDAEFIALANPSNILALVEALEKAQQQNKSDFEIKARLCKESNSLHDRLREAEKRIAELEDAEQKLCAANVTLDARAELAERQLESRTVKLPKKNIGWDRDEDDCWNNAIDACTEALTAAGIKVAE